MFFFFAILFVVIKISLCQFYESNYLVVGNIGCFPFDEWNSISRISEKRTNLRGIPIFGKISHREFPFNLTFFPEFPEFSVEWSGSSNNRTIFFGISFKWKAPIATHPPPPHPPERMLVVYHSHFPAFCLDCSNNKSLAQSGNMAQNHTS